MKLAAASASRRALVFGACGLALGGARGQTATATPAPAASSSLPSFSEAARQRLWAGSIDEAERHEQRRAALLAQAQRHLEAGDADAAVATLEQAALMRHAADTELALVRALMAQGHYQRALAACAHTAGAHPDERGGAALYSWLLHVGGQSVVARRFLDEALQRLPADGLLLHTQAALARDWPLAGAPLREGPWHAAPLPHGRGASTAVAAGARLLGTATLLGGGESAVAVAVVPARWLPATARLWVRNGLGQTVEVTSRQAVPAAAVAGEGAQTPGGHELIEMLVLGQPLPAPPWQAAAREPFAGSPAFMVEYAPDPLGRAAWPLLRQGFLAGVPGSPRGRPLGVQAPEGSRGGPVFDAFGRLAGIALPPARRTAVAAIGTAAIEPASAGHAAAAVAAAGDRLFGVAQLAALVPGLGLEVAAAGAATRIGPEVPYELALRGALQVLSDARDA